MLILASNSPRRKELLKGLGIPYDVLVIQGIDESYPDTLPANEVAEYIARKKADAYRDIAPGNTVLTADTVVVCEDEILGKPKDHDDAVRMLHKLSGKTHQVYTGVCLKFTQEGQSPLCKNRSFTVCTDVTFKVLSDEEIEHYVSVYKPFDKAGAYGIQEWIGYVGVTKLEGSYFNVMGLPVQRIFKEIRQL